MRAFGSVAGIRPTRRSSWSPPGWPQSTGTRTAAHCTPAASAQVLHDREASGVTSLSPVLATADSVGTAMHAATKTPPAIIDMSVDFMSIMLPEFHPNDIRYQPEICPNSETWRVQGFP